MAHRIRSGHTVSRSSGESFRDDAGNDVVVPAGHVVIRDGNGKPRHSVPADVFDSVFEETDDNAPANANEDDE